MNFPIVIHKDSDSDYGVTVPDLPGCFSAGETMDEALAMAKEAIELHLEGLIHEGQAIPSPSKLEKHQRNTEFKGGTWAIVTVDQSSLRIKARRINITMPERILDAVDRYAAKHGETRSGLLVQAVSEYMGRENAAGVPQKRRSPKVRGRKG